MPFSCLADELKQRDADGLLRRRRVLQSPQGARVRVDGEDVLSFCSNDYLGLANHPALVEAACAGAQRFGVGAGASHLVTGHTAVHHELEQKLAEFTGLPEALLFSTGYMANLGVVTALLGRCDALFADKLNHASLNDAALLSRATMTRYPHADLAVLERQLAASTARRKLVVSDAVFSMDGDIAPVPELLALCEKYDAWLLLDDAHGFGVLGKTGRGVLEHFSSRLTPHPSYTTFHATSRVESRNPPQVGRIIYMATLGKVAGVFGAFVAGAPELVAWLVQAARSYVYTTATPPLLAAALLASLRVIEAEAWRRERLAELVGVLRQGLQLQRWQLMPSETPIQPLLIGSSQDAVRVSESLRQRGILVPAIRPPTVPQGTARLRITLSAAHSVVDVQQLVDALRQLENE
ncbi:8-amino-7-oxononanoate synthase [Sulfurimicrobium lacus]|uniref:8-amino-7-oxononanoate synthase n=1 Tax=Sulfurimicrobium lacus TaxID=2715678 RepID=A0A6F8V6F5_9PROT|nr:8-amino-7-oxononanoate synthase [Sulfurimicrobium lacus]BCB25413.1 8-amino-7-oxononanoate synthase [Sulfurimicrobium lacus]